MTPGNFGKRLTWCSISTAILIVFLSGISWYTGFVIGQFKLRHPHVHSMGDAGEILIGRVGREILGTGQLLLLIFLMSSHLLTFTILMNTLTMHGTCTTVFGVVGLIVCFLGALPRTMGKVYWMSVACKFLQVDPHPFIFSLTTFSLCEYFHSDCSHYGFYRSWSWWNCPQWRRERDQLLQGLLSRDKHYICIQ